MGENYINWYKYTLGGNRSHQHVKWKPPSNRTVGILRKNTKLAAGVIMIC